MIRAHEAQFKYQVQAKIRRKESVAITCLQQYNHCHIYTFPNTKCIKSLKMSLTQLGTCRYKSEGYTARANANANRDLTIFMKYSRKVKMIEYPANRYSLIYWCMFDFFVFSHWNIARLRM